MEGVHTDLGGAVTANMYQLLMDALLSSPGRLRVYGAIPSQKQ